LFLNSGSFQVPGFAHFSRTHGVGFSIADELFCAGIPFQLAFKSHGDIAEVAETGTAMSGLSREIGFLTRLYTVKEVTVFASLAGVEVEALSGDWLVDDFPAACFKA
jgi:hypothetical protein